MRIWLTFLSLIVMTGGLLNSLAEAATNCSISTVGVSFGSYNVFSPTTLTSTGTTSLLCTGFGSGVQTVTVWLSPGGANSFNPRKMFRSTEALTYNLYQDAAGTQVWGDGTGGSVALSTSLSNNKNVTTTIFGRIPAGQDVSVGSYTDTIIATINF